MKEIIIIHGGDAYTSHEEYVEAIKSHPPRFKDGKQRWKSNLAAELEGLYTVHNPQFPSQDNAQFELWCITFNKVLEQTGDDILLIGHSLGANFLQSYLGRFKVAKNIHEIHFVSACVSEGNFYETENWTRISQSSNSIHIWHSTDDPVVDYREGQYYHNKLPGSILRTLDDRKHFNQAYFPELSAHLINQYYQPQN